MSIENEKVCCNCRHNIRKHEDGYINCYCDIDGSRLDYSAIMSYWCKRWEKEKASLSKTDQNQKEKNVRCLENDVLLLCKRHYANEHKTLLDALSAYYNKRYRFPGERKTKISYKLAVELLLKPCVEKYVNGNNLWEFLYRLFQETCQEKSSLNPNGCTEFYEVLFNRLVLWISLLELDGKPLIENLPGYSEDEDII